MKSKIKTLEQLILLRKQLKKAGGKVVFTNGCFDILHPGHIRLFKAARQEGDILIVAVNIDETIHKLKGSSRPIFPLKERLEILEAIEVIDYLFPFKEETPLKVINSLLPDVLVKGGDWLPKDVVGAQEVKRSGGRLVIVPYISNFSTSSIIKHIIEE